MNTYQQEHYQNCKDNSSMLIDEISMVSDTMLTYISRRLSDIKASNHAFENMNVIVIGDFFSRKVCISKYFTVPAISPHIPT